MGKMFLLKLFLVGCTIQLVAQKQMSGLVLEHASKRPIPYANIGILNSVIGTISNEDGSYSILIPEAYENDTIIFSALGFTRSAIPVASIGNENTTIYLSEKVTTLQSVTVTGKNEKKETFWLGNRYSKGGFMYADSISAGSAMALLIENKYPAYHPELTFPVYVDEATLRINSNRMDEFKVRVRLLDVDSVTGLPGRDLFEESLIVTSSIKKGWITFNLAPFNFKIDQPAFFLVFEWILDDKDRLALLGQYAQYRKENPDKVKVDTMVVRGEKITFYSYFDFRPATHFSVSPIPFSLDNYKCYYRTNSFGEWKTAPVILTARISVSNQP